MKFGLDNITRLCEALGHPERTFHSVLIAGTNGKGSVTAMVHRALIAAGHRAARYTSPHLERIEERYVVGAREADTRDLTRAAANVRDAIGRLQTEGGLESPPTFFESATAMAFDLFRSAEVRLAVLEVGLGGRLDATNVVPRIAAAITSIDFDHQAQLGHTIESIAFEKAGVIRPGIPVVCGELQPEAAAVIEGVCRNLGARYIAAVDFSDLAVRYRLPEPSLRGLHQRRNAAVAVRLLLELRSLGIKVDDDAIRSGLTEVDWPGRLELLRYSQADVLLDAAHNPAGARALAAYLREVGWAGECALLFGAMQDKDVAAMLAELAPVCPAVVCTTADTPRARDASDLARVAGSIPGATWRVSHEPDPALALARAATSSDRVVAAGSIFLIGPLRGILRAR